MAFARQEYEQIVFSIDQERAERYSELAALEAQIEETQEVIELQDLGLVFGGEHPVAASVDLKDSIDTARKRRSQMSKDGRAVLGNQSWAVGGDLSEGRKLVGEITKLMLRAYNNEVDALVKATNATNASKKVDSLGKKRDQIRKLGNRMGLEIAMEYHDLAVYEIRTTGQFQLAKQAEKEADREHREQLREEKRVADQLKAEQAKLDKELAQYRNALAAIESNPTATDDEVEELRRQIDEVELAQSDITRRAANTRAGHVYVISNPGSFGDEVVKIGMTRRLDPMERVVELGDASVPFRYSLHALIFSDDAVGLETALHQRFADQRINRVNMRREFFRVTPADVRAALLDFNAHVVEFDETPVDEEWEASR